MRSLRRSPRCPPTPTRRFPARSPPQRGERLGGVTVSAKAEGATITTSVYTDASGNYYFPPLPEGNYRVWAQAVQFETARNNVTVGQSRQQNFVLKPITDREAWIRQLPGDEFLAALPGDTPEDFRMKTQVRKNCTGCHSASYVLQHRFDEEGWYKILDLMKQVNVNGTYPRPDKRMTPNIDFHQTRTRRLSRAGARTRRELDAVQSAAAPVRRSGAHRRQGIRLPDRGQPPPDQ